MKTFYTVACVLFITISLSFTSKKTTQENTLKATFLEVTEEDYYKFIDQDKKEILFYDTAEDVEISLYDDEYIGKKFSITWVEKEIELFDSEGELTGEKKKVKSITILTLLK